MPPPHPVIPATPAAARLAVATRSRPMSQGLPRFLKRRTRRVRPRGNRIIATNISGRRFPLGPSRRDPIAVPVVPTVSVLVNGPVEGTVKLLGAKLQVTSVGNVPQEKFTMPVNPPVGVSVITVLPVDPLLMVRDDGLAASV